MAYYQPPCAKYCLLLCLIITLPGCQIIKEIPYGHGFMAKNLCSGIFVSGLDEEKLKQDFLGPSVKPLNYVWRIQIDSHQGIVTVSDWVFGSMFKQTAFHRPGFGCTLLGKSNPGVLVAQTPAPVSYSISSQATWPRGNAPGLSGTVNGVDYMKLEKAVSQAFLEPRDTRRQTTAVLVAYQGKLIAERYAKGITTDSKLMGWSMAKSVTGSLVGLLSDRHEIDVKELIQLPEWQGTGKESIRIENLLHMASGIDYHEKSSGPNADQSRMLYMVERFSDYLLQQPIINQPGTRYNYSTADSMVLARIIQNKLGGELKHSYRFAQESLFEPIGITSAVMEYDTSGQLATGAYLLMKPRDWLRLGQLYLNQGDWFGHQVLSNDWIRYASTPSPANSRYGAHLWLNSERKLWPKIPEDAFGFMGYQKQRLIVVPSKSLVVLKMGFSYEKHNDVINDLVENIISTLPNQ